MDEVSAKGRITFARYMDLALYHPELGYYSSSKPHIGAEGDYYTSTDVSPLFGAIIGRQLNEIWKGMERPSPFQVIEFGAGKGLLAADILGWSGTAHPELFDSMEYSIIEKSAGMRRNQQEALRRLPVSWTDLESVPHGSVTGCFISNEVADAFPVHRVRMLKGELRELWVTERGQHLGEELGALSTPDIDEYLKAFGVGLAEGQTAEVCLEAPRWMRAQTERLRSGYALTIDYGSTASQLYGPAHPDGTLACYHRHQLNKQPFERVGEQDITALVNFSALAKAARLSGATIAGYTSQAHFLASLGIGEALSAHAEMQERDPKFRQYRAAIARLVDPNGLGSFRVLAATKGDVDRRLTGFALLNEHDKV